MAQTAFLTVTGPYGIKLALDEPGFYLSVFNSPENRLKLSAFLF